MVGGGPVGGAAVVSGAEGDDVVVGSDGAGGGGVDPAAAVAGAARGAVCGVVPPGAPAPVRLEGPDAHATAPTAVTNTTATAAARGPCRRKEDRARPRGSMLNP